MVPSLNVTLVGPQKVKKRCSIGGGHQSMANHCEVHHSIGLGEISEALLQNHEVGGGVAIHQSAKHDRCHWYPS